MTSKKKIKQQIEKTRHEMYQIYENDPKSSQLLEISQELDSLLNEYHKLQNHNPKG